MRKVKILIRDDFEKVRISIKTSEKIQAVAKKIQDLYQGDAK